MTFTQLGTIHSQNHRHMTELRRFPAQCFVNQQLLRSVGKMLLSAQYVSHAHQMVIDTNSEVIGRNTVGFYNYEIIKLVHVKGNFAMNQIMILPSAGILIRMEYGSPAAMRALASSAGISRQVRA